MTSLEDLRQIMENVGIVVDQQEVDLSRLDSAPIPPSASLGCHDRDGAGPFVNTSTLQIALYWLVVPQQPALKAEVLTELAPMYTHVRRVSEVFLPDRIPRVVTPGDTVNAESRSVQNDFAPNVPDLLEGAEVFSLDTAALLAGTRPGLTERELGNMVERAYVGHGGMTMIHYIGVTSMVKPHIFVPPQYHSPRKVQKGDVNVRRFIAD